LPDRGHGRPPRARQTLERQPANRPAPGTAVVTDRGLSRQETEEFGARIIQRLLALNACIWHNWQIGTPSNDP
jgi:hypothetical protein